VVKYDSTYHEGLNRSCWTRVCDLELLCFEAEAWMCEPNLFPSTK